MVPFKVLDLMWTAKSCVTRKKRYGEIGQPCRIRRFMSNHGVVPECSFIDPLLLENEVQIALLNRDPKPKFSRELEINVCSTEQLLKLCSRYKIGRTTGTTVFFANVLPPALRHSDRRL